MHLYSHSVTSPSWTTETKMGPWRALYLSLDLIIKSIYLAILPCTSHALSSGSPTRSDTGSPKAPVVPNSTHRKVESSLCSLAFQSIRENQEIDSPFLLRSSLVLEISPLRNRVELEWMMHDKGKGSKHRAITDETKSTRKRTEISRHRARTFAGLQYLSRFLIPYLSEVEVGSTPLSIVVGLHAEVVVAPILSRLVKSLSAEVDAFEVRFLTENRTHEDE